MAPALTSDVILRTALDCFAAAGFDGTSVRDICRRLEVSHNLVHERFGTKERLWYAAVDHGFQALAVELVAAAQEADPDPLERLRAILVRYVEVTAERPALIRVVNQEAARPGPRLDHIFEHYIRPAHDVADVTLRLLEAEGRAHRVPAATLHFLVGHGAGGLASLPALATRFGAADPGPVEQARQAVDLILRGIVR